MFHNLENGGSNRRNLTLPLLDTESKVIAALSLKCLTHLFSWIPLSSLITPQLVNTIFIFASLGADPMHNNKSLHNTSSNSNHLHSGNGAVDVEITNLEPLGVYAMGAINEIISKNCVPHDFEDFLLQMFRNTFQLLQRIVTDQSDCIDHLQSLPENYLSRFTEFLRFLVSNHMRRFENNAQFPILEFLSLLFRYTFAQPRTEAYFNCLEVWAIFLEHLTAKCRNSEDNIAIVGRLVKNIIYLL